MFIALESGIQLKKSRIPSTIDVRFQVPLTKNLEFITWNPESIERNPESKTLGLPCMRRMSDAHAHVHVIMMRPNFKGLTRPQELSMTPWVIWYGLL